MTFTHIDLIGLNKYDMHDAPIVRTDTELKEIAQKSKNANRSISIAGMRHSQGGHTALRGESMVFTEAMEQNIKYIKEIKEIVGIDGGVVGIVEIEETDPNPSNLEFIKVNAGATWSDIHFHLGPMGYAPLVHQSSPHFSIGGSLSVDCHGREVCKGALSNTVETITVLTNKVGEGLKPTQASRTLNPDLFFGALGGYGACGVILEATIRITENIRMYKFGNKVEEDPNPGPDPQQNYLKLKKFFEAASHGKRNNYPDQILTMFYAWMDVSHDKNKYLTHAMVYEYPFQKNSNLSMRVKDFKEEGWATTEVMRTAWSAARRSSTLRTKLFKEIADASTGMLFEDSLINFLREEISFTSTKGDVNDVDLLQEFFIPLPKMSDFLMELKKILPMNDTKIEVLSCTLRIIQPPKAGRGKPFLSYAHRDNPFTTPMVSVALEVKVNKSTSDDTKCVIHPDYKVNGDALERIQDVINLAISLGGSYYLPYYQAATPTQFKAAYHPGHREWKQAANKWNPKVPENGGSRIFYNEFLKVYLDENQ